jgi:signal transduction histidine kinase
MICPFFSPPEYFIFATAVPPLLYYSYLPALLISFPFGLYIFIKNPKLLLNKLLFTLTTIFAVWAFFILILWTNINSDIIFFFWSFLGILSSLIAICSIYFISVFLRNGNDVSIFEKIIYLCTLIPAIVLTPTNTNLSGFDMNICGSSGYVGFNFVTYYYLLGLLSILWIIGLLVNKYRKSDITFRKQIIIMGTGMVSFLSLFFSIGYYVNYINEAGITDSYSIELYGMFGMVIFIIFISVLIVKFKTFNVKLIATQALVWGLIAIIGSQFFFIKENTNFILNGIGFLASIIFGQFLVKSVKKEIEQKEQLAKLDIELESLIKQRENLVHLVTHKVKGSFTRSKYIFAGLLDGTFGTITPEIKKIAEQGLESDNMGIETVDLVLSVANMQKGTVKYEMKELNLKELVEKTLADKKMAIETKGLEVETQITEPEYKVFGDAFWLREVVNNFIENSTKYTQKGKIVVGLQKKDGKILFSVKDTGIGITDEDKKNLFTEGGRGKDSVKVNVDSTGYGLYSVKLIVEAHKGRVWAESEGSGKGSTFFVELPAA